MDIHYFYQKSRTYSYRGIFFFFSLVCKFYTVFLSSSVLVSQVCFSWFQNLCLQTWTQEEKKRAAWSLEHSRGYQAKLTLQPAEHCPCVSEIRQLQPQQPKSSQPQWPLVRNLAMSPDPWVGLEYCNQTPLPNPLNSSGTKKEQGWDESYLKKGCRRKKRKDNRTALRW